MKHLVKYAAMMCMVLAMGLTFTSCGSDGDSDDPATGTVTITNNSKYDLPQFTVVFLNAQYEELTDRNYGTLYADDKIECTIPTAAAQYYMATRLNGTWYFSAYYSISHRNMKLTTAEVGNWKSND
jgi:hypothetical protein